MNKKLFGILTIVLLLCLCGTMLGLSACVPNTPPADDDGSTPTPPAPVEQGLPTDIPATAESPSLQIHYYRVKATDYKSWGFWLWPKDGEGKLFNLNYQDDFGGVAVVSLAEIGGNTMAGIGLIPRKQADWTKDCDADRSVDLTKLTKDAGGYYHIYLIEGDVSIYSSVTENMKKKMNDLQYGIKASFDSATSLKVTAVKEFTKIELIAGEISLGEQSIDSKKSATYSVPASHTTSVDIAYAIKVTFTDGKVASALVNVNSLFDTADFDAQYYYDGPLGVAYTPSASTFRVWSPVSSAIELCIYQSGHLDEIPATYTMTKGDKGVFEVIVEEDLAGKYYTYKVTNSTYTAQEVVDPYAKSAGLSGMRGQIVDFAETNPEGWDAVSPIAYSRRELVVWETHVSDVTSSATWTGTEAYRKKFLGLIEQGTTYTAGEQTVSTGFDHIVDLGVNAVQLVPIFDQANDETKMVFNWGYNPLNYNVLEGSYSTDPTNGYTRIREFKQVVSAFNKAGINIIMDVVYNHVNAASGSNFDVLMPGYYFRYNASGALSNGSGCGNETASERSMMRKFMIDSAVFWTQEYKLGGFRFDLMGVHDIETMNLLTQAVTEVNPNMVVYGEPWTGGTTALDKEKSAIQANGNSFEGYGQFNDQMRDALIKGGLNATTTLGWVTNYETISNADVRKIIEGMQGIVSGSNYTITDPDKAVNYVTCHDNYTLFDRMWVAGHHNLNRMLKMSVLANAVVLTSNGTTFMLAGEELMRSKDNNGNSYDASYAVNELDYSRKIDYIREYELYKQLIAFKRNTQHLQLSESEMSDYKPTSIANGAVITVSFEEDGKTYQIFHANGATADCAVNLEGYTILVDTIGDTTLSAETLLKPYQTLIVCKTNE